MADSHGVVHRLQIICESSFIVQSTGRESKLFLYTLLVSRGPHLSPRVLVADLPILFFPNPSLANWPMSFCPWTSTDLYPRLSLCVWPNVPSHPQSADQRDIPALWPLKDIRNVATVEFCFLNMIHIILSKSIHWFHCQMIIDRVLKDPSLPRTLLTYTQCPTLIINSAAFSS